MTPHIRQTNHLLGYPDDARLLIINADDFGMAHTINEATLRAFRDGVVRSTSLMVPCPWTLEAMQMLTENPDIAFGVHLTVICDTDTRNWTPLTSAGKVPSLVDERGCFLTTPRLDELLARAKL